MSMPTRGGRGGQQQDDEQQDREREEDALGRGHRAQLVHRHRALLLGGEGPHDRGLDDGHERHVGVGGDGDRPEKIRAQPADARKIAVGPSAPPMMPMAAAS